jgi:hypothetical protein
VHHCGRTHGGRPSSAELLKDVGALWSHPGVSLDRRKDFAEEVFEEIRLDQAGIRSVLVRKD